MAKMSASDQFMFGAGITSAKLPNIGDNIRGLIYEVSDPYTARDIDGKIEYWDEDLPTKREKKQVRLTLLTEERDPEDEEDDGLRAFYLKEGTNLRRVIADAVVAADAKKWALGGELYVEYEENGKPRNKSYKPPKLHKAEYTKPTPETVKRVLDLKAANSKPIQESEDFEPDDNDDALNLDDD